MEYATIIWNRLLLAFCLFGPLLLIVAVGARILYRRGKSSTWGRIAAVAIFALPAIYVGATKPVSGRVTVTDDYIQDAGSYLTNDVAHVAIAKRTNLLPDDTEILVYARELSQSNAVDWVRLEPHLTFRDHPYDYSLPNATNYNVMVAASYTPAPTVHTNGVWIIRGFVIPGGNRMAFPNSKIKKE